MRWSRESAKLNANEMMRVSKRKARFGEIVTSKGLIDELVISSQFQSVAAPVLYRARFTIIEQQYNFDSEGPEIAKKKYSVETVKPKKRNNSNKYMWI